jgi:hypothetical protein
MRCEEPRAPRDGEFTAMGDKLGACMRVAWGDGVAQGPCQGPFRVEVGGFEVERANPCFFFVGVLGGNVDADFRLQVRWHFGAATDELTVYARAQMAPLEA